MLRAPGSPAEQILGQHSASRYLEDIIRVAGAAASTLSRRDRPFTGITPEELSPVIESIDLNQPLGSIDETLAELNSVYLRDALYFHVPRYAAHLNCPVVIPAVAAEVVLSAVNSSMDTWDQSAGATLIERKLIDWTAALFGLGENADGVFTSGGSQSNLQALLIARNHAVARLQEQYGSAAQAPRLPLLLDRMRIFTSRMSHFSVQKSAAILGLGYDAVIPVEVDANWRMDPQDLRRAIRECLAEGQIPIAVVGTAGTTDFGAIDPLSELAEIAAEHQGWFHVDAAYGGGLITSDRYRHLLDGVEHADSVTVDYHKTFFQPVSSSAVIVRNREALQHVTYYADYLNPAEAAAAAIPNQVDKSLQTTRRFDALKLWFTLRVMGRENLGGLLDQTIDLTTAVHRRLRADVEFEVLNEPQLSALVFRYLPRPDTGLSGEQLNELNRRIRSELFGSGEAVVAGTVVNGVNYLKFTLLNPQATVADIEEIIDLLRAHGRRLAAAGAV
ncbi:aspartate aminotransferase family protein [Acaricomes phytoseiuli]|nr:aspartate aminotransferase family protein [Acaricomes phytoseiuli]MCW1249452.1 aspartate aminotransferase family protein [Acaricomes phytoseiuli]